MVRKGAVLCLFTDGLAQITSKRTPSPPPEGYRTRRWLAILKRPTNYLNMALCVSADDACGWGGVAAFIKIKCKYDLYSSFFYCTRAIVLVRFSVLHLRHTPVTMSLIVIRFSRLLKVLSTEMVLAESGVIRKVANY